MNNNCDWNIIRINDLSAPELEMYCRCNESQLLHYYEPDAGVFIAESPVVIERAMDAGYEPISFLIEETHAFSQMRPLLERFKDIPIYTAPYELLKHMTGFALTTGALCAMRRVSLRTPEEICKGKKRIAVLEHVVNPTNVGAIFRSAAAMFMDAVLLTSDCCDPFYRRSIRVSMGNVFLIPWTYMDVKDHDRSISDNHYIELLHNLGFQTAAMALTDNSISIEDEKLKKAEKLAVILGSEGPGLLQDTLDRSDYTVKIPMADGVDSLNVAAASAVAFWELRNK